MWADLGYELPIKEGVYWLDNNFIKAFTPDGTLHKLWKYKVFDDLHIEITKYKGNKMVLSIITIFNVLHLCSSELRPFQDHLRPKVSYNTRII